MGERTSYPHGTFCFADLATTDAAAAKAFYTALFGWGAEEQPLSQGGVYVMLKRDGHDVAALYEQQEEERNAGIPPHWSCYIAVDDVDAVAGRVRELGGELMAEPFDVMDAGRMAVLRDPTGAIVSLWRAGRSIGATWVNDPGSLTMTELATPDPDRAAAFYEVLLGWTTEVVDEASGYRSFKVGERLNAGMRPDTSMPANWVPYFTVASLDDALERARNSGGAVVVEPVTIPAGRFAALADPQGAVFCSFEGEVDD
jgi:uncharacterized protein